MSIAGINGTSELQSEKFTVSISATNQDSSEQHEVVFYERPNIQMGSAEYDVPKLKRQYSHLNVLADDKLKLKDVRLILGQDAYELIRAEEYRTGEHKQPWAVKTKLGWTLCGPLVRKETSYLAVATYLASVNQDPLAEQLKSWWSMESYSTQCDVSGRSKDDQRALQILQETTKHSGERYEVGLLWAENNPVVPNNYANAAAQLKSLERRLQKDTSLRDRYQETIDVDVAKGCVRKLDLAEVQATGDKPQWYLPHHYVINPNKPEKVRRVCNAAAKFKGVSLNDKLLTGPDLLQNLIGIIFRFREHSVAVTADVEAMFLQVSVPSDDCKFLRFL